MRISDWSSDVCSSDLCPPAIESSIPWAALNIADIGIVPIAPALDNIWASKDAFELGKRAQEVNQSLQLFYVPSRSEEHTSELQSLMSISYAVFCLTKKR